MFAWLAKYQKVIVTGPHRAGTRVCAQMIAHDTGHRFVDESEIHFDSLWRAVPLLRNETPMVIQAPALCRYAHTLSALRPDDIAVVMMRRDVGQILASQGRIGWAWTPAELARYDLGEGVIAEVKYRFWEEHQKPLIRHAFDIEYSSLSAHPLWLPDEQRRGFAARQTHAARPSAQIAPASRPYPRSDVLCFEDPESDTVVLGFATGYGEPAAPAKLLNSSARFIWNLCDGAHTRDEILRALRARYDEVAEATLAQDLDEFLRSMVKQDFLRLATDGV